MNKGLNDREGTTKCISNSKKGTKYLHPSTLEPINTKDYSCAIIPMYKKISGKDEEVEIIKTDNEIIVNESISFINGFLFSENSFLSDVYGINNLDEMINYIEDVRNNIENERTIQRIQNASWIAFMNSNTLSNNIIQFYYKYILSKIDLELELEEFKSIIQKYVSENETNWKNPNLNSPLKSLFSLFD